MEKLAFSVEEMAESLSIGRSKAFELCRSENFPAVKIGNRLIIPIDELKKWLERQAQADGA